MAGGKGGDPVAQLVRAYGERIEPVVGRSKHAVERRTAAASILSNGHAATKEAKATGKVIDRSHAKEIQAWAAFDEIGEVTTMVEGTAGLLSQCYFYPGVRMKDGDKWVEKPVDQVPGIDRAVADQINDLWARFVDANGSQSGLVRSVSENWSVVAHARLVGYLQNEEGDIAKEMPDNADDIPDGYREVWHAVAPSSLYLDKQKDNVWTLKLTECESVELTNPIIYDLRWSHPRYPKRSLGWVMAALDICRDLRTFTMAQRSSARSGIPADLFIVPLEANPKRPRALTLEGQDDNEPYDPQAAANEFADDVEEMFGEFMLDATNDSESGMSVVPGVMAVSKDMIEAFTKISMARQVDRGLGELVNQARMRLAEVADCPPEMLKGLGSTNRWNATGVVEQEYRRYFRPKANAIADAFTAGPFRHSMEAAELIEVMKEHRIRILVDASDAVVPPDYTKLVFGMVDRAIIGPSGALQILSLNPSYAPTPEELKFMEAWKQIGKAQPSDNTGKGDQGPPSDSGEPNDSKGAVVHGHVRVPQPALSASTAGALADQLAAIELATRARLAEAAEAALDRALDRASAKLAGWARKAKLASFSPEQAKALAADNGATDEEMWAAALAALAVAFRRIVLEALAEAQRIIGATIPQVEIDAALNRAEATLIDGMMQLANAKVFAPPPPENTGELSLLNVPTTVLRRALAVAGGALGVGPGLDGSAEAAMGLVFGPLLARITPEVADLQWVYGTAHRQRHFQPHLELDGETFTGPTDPKLAQDTFSAYPYWYPGDHGGCQCLWKPVYVTDQE